MKENKAIQIGKDERGFITLDFAFALMIALGFSVVFFAISITLSMVEVTQYIAFASSRAYMAAHETRDLQEQNGRNKFEEVMDYPAFKMLLKPTWFKIGDVQIGKFGTDYQDYQAANIDSQTFEGARIQIVARLLNLRVPFLGPTVTKSGTGTANISSYLSREVSTEECREQFTRNRFLNLRAATFGGATPYAAAPTNAAVEALITDNGC